MKIAVCYNQNKPDRNKKFVGIEGESTVYKPSVIGDSQWSKARMKLLNGPDIIEVGWMVSSFPKCLHYFIIL